MQNYRNEMNGKVVFMWKGQNNTFWCKMAYWIGTGYQYVEREVDQDVYELWSL